ncbi:MAG: hypothetical protein PHR60_04195 [Eubacteriales bacterium]|nr:hypothetical protein [Eubacteriales bacterium]MDD4583372.1 hypothetical protein [Eubacteriales bacterium]
MIDKDDLLAREIIRENTGGKDMELSLVDDFLEELDLRLDHVKIYYPIMEMLRRRKIEELSNLVPELSFLLLSYLIYEGKLKYRGITFQDIERLLSKALKEILMKETEPKTLREVTIELLDGLQNGGRNFTINTFSFRTGNFKEKYIKLLEIRQSNDGELQYYVTEQGVDFYLKTKEFPEETKITINLLLFQKQMEKGAFGFAYETVRRLNMEVEKKKDKKYSLLEALMYGRLDSGETYDSYHQSIVMQLEEETELFNLAVKNVSMAFGEYMERINSGEATEKEKRTFTLIKIIEKEVGRAQTLHTGLLKEAVGFTREYDRVLGIRRKAIFTERFNFQGEFEKTITQNKPPEVLKYLFEPLLNPYIKKSFNPLRALEPQRITKDRQEDLEDQVSEKVDRATIDSITRERVKGNFIFYATRLLEVLDRSQGQVNLQDYCQSLVKKYTEDSVYNGDFLSFILEMNRNKIVGETTRTITFNDEKIELDEEVKTMEEVFFKASLVAHMENKIGSITVQSFPEEDVELLPGLKITNLLIKGEHKL